MEIPVLTAYCGVDCSGCADYKNRKCPGCRESTWPDGDECPPVSCCRKQGIVFCGDCSRFPCKMMREFYEESDSHRDAYRRLEEYRKDRRGSENESGIQG